MTMRRIKIGELCVCKKDVFQKPNQIVRVVKRQRTVVDKIKVIGDLEEDGYCKRVYHYADPFLHSNCSRGAYELALIASFPWSDPIPTEG